MNTGPLPWQYLAWESLLTRADDRLPHGLLLVGEAGIGKRKFADAFAAFLLCSAPSGQPVQACGRCKSCLLIAAGSHPDLMVVVPEAMRVGEDEESSKKKKPSREIRIDEVRTLIGFAAQTAQFGGRRVVIIDPATAMNTNAANALLKTLEEPGEGTVLLLVCDRPATLPATIRSRCQLLPLPVPAPTQAQAWLADTLGDAKQAAVLLAAAGNPLRALALAEEGEWLGQRRELAGLLVGVLTGEASAVRFAELAAKAPEAMLLDWLSSLLADAVRLAGGIPVERLRNGDLARELQRLVAARSTQPLFLLGDDLTRLRQQLNANTGLSRPLLWEEVMLRWAPRAGTPKKAEQGSP